ncbi:TVP38/TMEM64 family protein [Caulobacter sp. CCUG 60055]|uniref:TVP38/TMEM64 family protein n=1 Tax=Caulobacter sp. CCUG 60055 TaxID=2100090 RepID=UPI001FA7CFD8|nr:VTT domain-containing protein [Caulobacter sp. CCUG 60055]MCI3181972.1 TVP38/TMEM64 family protein [Caulobacter sp. CCUG 60055]
MSYLKRFGPLALVAAVLIWAFASGVAQRLAPHNALHELEARRHVLEAMASGHPAAAVAGYVCAYALLVGCSVPASLFMTLLGGFLFGPWLGGAAATVGCAAGSVLIFAVGRTALGDLLRGRAGGAIARMEAGVRDNAFLFLISARLLPVLPFWLTNLASAFVAIPLRTYALATLIGVLPGSFIYAGLGAGLKRAIDAGGRPSLALLADPRILAPLCALAVLSLAPMLLRRRRRDGTI